MSEITKEELVKQITEETEVNNAIIKKVLLGNLFKFNRFALGIEDNKNAVKLAPFHQEMCQFIDRNPKRFKLILVPRGHLKSSLVTIGKSLQWMYHDPSVRILIANATYTMATTFVGQIQRHLKFNGKLLTKFGSIADNPANWTANSITLEAAKEAHGKKEATLTGFGMGGNLVSQHYDKIILDDIVNRDTINTREQIDKTILFLKDILDLLEPGGELLILGCLIEGTNVTMADGQTKSIEKIKVGEKVISHDSVETVEAMMPQGKAEVFELKTRNHTIQATGNHPFLTKDGFVRLDTLKIKQKIKIHRYFSSRSNRDKYTVDDMWILGFMLGDGWITENPDKKYNSMRLITCVAKSVYEERNKKVLSILSKKGKFKETDHGYYRSENIAVGRYLKKLGFEGNAKTKRVPRFVFSLSVKLREAFLDGFCQADGYANKGLRCIELSNQELVRDLKHLSESCGYKVSNIYKRIRVSQPPHSPKPILVSSYHIAIGNRKKEIKWDWETIVSITPVGKKEVYDLTVSNTHNFIAEGLVVHNTRWHDQDLYGWIMDKDNDMISSFDVFLRPAFTGNLRDHTNFQALWPEKYTRSVLEKLYREKGPYEFSAQYLNDPTPDEDATFQRKWFHYYDETELRGRPLNKFTAVDPAISLEKEADYTTVVTMGVDHFHNWYILDIFRDRVTPSQLIEKLYSTYERWHPIEIAIENVAFQKVLQYAINEEGRKRKKYLPIVEVKPENRTKDERIRSLQPLYANGVILHRKELVYNDYLEDELTRFPRGKHDDIIDALSYMKDIVSAPRAATRNYESEGRQHHYLY